MRSLLNVKIFLLLFKDSRTTSVVTTLLNNKVSDAAEYLQPSQAKEKYMKSLLPPNHGFTSVTGSVVYIFIYNRWLLGHSGYVVTVVDICFKIFMWLLPLSLMTTTSPPWFNTQIIFCHLASPLRDAWVGLRAHFTLTFAALQMKSCSLYDLSSPTISVKPIIITW